MQDVRKILCIEKSVLKGMKGLTKDIPLEKYLLENTDYKEVDVDWSDTYIPLTFSTTVRSMYSNKVVYKVLKNKDNQDYRVYYESLTEIEPIIHKGYDLVMFLSSIAVQKMIKAEAQQTLGEIMCASTFSVRGLRYVEDAGVIRPIVYSQIVISDEAFERFEKILDHEHGACSIEEMRENIHGNLYDLLDDIVIVKEKNNEQG